MSLSDYREVEMNGREEVEAVSYEETGADGPNTVFLSNGRYTTLVSGNGAGFSSVGSTAITRWTADRTSDREGFVLYLRDRDAGTVWNTGLVPTTARPDVYEFRVFPDRVQILTVFDGIESLLDVSVHPDVDVEHRTVTLTNRSERRRRIELTSCIELALNARDADAAHPAFSKLFVQTEYDPSRHILYARRRPRSPRENPVWVFHSLSGDGLNDVRFETNRARFIGRGFSTGLPAALATSEPRTGEAGNVLDPMFSLQTVVTIDPGVSATCSFVLGVSQDRDGITGLAGQGAREHGSTPAGETDLTFTVKRRLDCLAGCLMYGGYAERRKGVSLPLDPEALNLLSQAGLSPSRPMMAVRLSDRDDRESVSVLIETFRYWKAIGLPIQAALYLDGTDPAGPITEQIRTAGLSDQIQTFAASTVSERFWPVLSSRARLVFDGRFDAEIPPPTGVPEVESSTAYRPAFETSVPDESPESAPENLVLENGFGGFTKDGTEYVIRIPYQSDGTFRRPPLAWTNVIANEHTGFIVSEAGTGNTWSENSRENRLTPWSNDPIVDPHGEAVYLRDEDERVYWSPTAGPAPDRAGYGTRHGMGYTTFRHRSNGFEQEVIQFVPRHLPVKITRVRITNLSNRSRRLSVFQFSQLVLGGLPETTAPFVVTEYDDSARALLAANPENSEFAHRVAVAAAIPASESSHLSFTADRTSFVGRNGTMARPRAVEQVVDLDGVVGAGYDPCAAFQIGLEVRPGVTVETSFLLGQTESREEAIALVDHFRQPEAVQRELDGIRSFWADLVGRVRVQSPTPAIDLMVNGWLVYQNLSCRIWGRSAFYQSGGAYGFRDQLQDSGALVYLQPELTRNQILLHAAHQFVEGDVMHWWHPPLNRGMRTRFSDDLLWLPYLTLFYIKTTGDRSILTERAGFLTTRFLEEGEDEAYLIPEEAGVEADLYEHCCRSLDRSLTAGPHGLPLMGVGDWNDGMNRVGREGRGESVWLGFFIYTILEEFIPICETRGDLDRAATYREYQSNLYERLNDSGWDGAWYRRAYYDNGQPLGSAQSDECKNDALAQAWAVISKAAPDDRAEMALDAAERYLVSEEEGLIRLLTPAFVNTPNDPGYIKGYVAGVRENGGQYTHGVLWLIKALAEAGRGERAARLLEMLSPISRAADPFRVSIYQVEPYVVAADVYGEPPHVGRGGWTWYTGSAGWFYRVALESIYGLTLEDGRFLVIDPCIPSGWEGFTVRYTLPGSQTVYDVRVENPSGVVKGVAAVYLDGAAVPPVSGKARLPLLTDDREHTVRVVMGNLK